jgi:hypothetical protein
MDDRRIARAIAGTEPDAEQRARRRRNRWRVFFRVIAVICFLAGAALLALLLRPLPRQAELQYTQGTIRKAQWVGERFPRFEIALEQERRSYLVDQELVERVLGRGGGGGGNVGEMLRVGRTARVGYAPRRSALRDGGRYRAWDLAVDEREIYTLDDARRREAQRAPPLWLASLTLLAAGVIGWFLTPRPRRKHRYRHRSR